MSQKHIIMIQGGPYDGALIDLADTAYLVEPLADLLPPTLFGVPVELVDGRYIVKWSDVESVADEKRLAGISVFVDRYRNVFEAGE